MIADILGLRAEYEVVGFLDDANPARAGETFLGKPILGGRERLEDLREGGVGYLIFGFGDGVARLRLSRLARGEGFRLATAVHPRSVIAADVNVGDGTVVAAGAVVNPGTTIGENVIVNTSAGVDHDCVLEDGTHISPGVRLAGGVTVGRAAWVGIGATVVGRVRVGAGSIIGAGAVVLEDVPDGVVAYGVPARVVREVESTDG